MQVIRKQIHASFEYITTLKVFFVSRYMQESSLQILCKFLPWTIISSSNQMWRSPLRVSTVSENCLIDEGRWNKMKMFQKSDNPKYVRRRSLTVMLDNGSENMDWFQWKTKISVSYSCLIDCTRITVDSSLFLVLINSHFPFESFVLSCRFTKVFLAVCSQVPK